MPFLQRIVTVFIITFFTSSPACMAQPATPPAVIARTDTTTADTLHGKYLTQNILRNHPFYNFKTPGIPSLIQKKQPAAGKEFYFYTLLAVLLCFAGFRAGFENYFSGLSSLFFKKSLKQRQVKQQLAQNTVTALIFDIFFFIIAGYYAALYAARSLPVAYPFTRLLLYCIAGIAGIYLLKYLVLKLIGWLFQSQKIFNEYLFNIFYTNKIVSLALLPVIFLASLTREPFITVIFTISICMIGAAFLYRTALCLPLIRKAMSTQPLLFLLYLLLIEILPVLLLLKAFRHYVL